jgi:hypothetical protein
MDFVELGARTINLVDLVFLEVGCLVEKIGAEIFEPGAALSPRKHALNKEEASAPCGVAVGWVGMTWMAVV